MQFLLTVVLSAVFYLNGETAASGVRRFGRRLAGARGDEVVMLAGRAIRAVALGIVVTAVVQSLLAGLGLFVAGIPFAAVLTGITFMCCIAQVGPILVLVPSIAYLYMQGRSGTATLLLVWSVLVLLLDNVMRPILIRKGADLPLLLIFAGVIGGLLSLGVIGLFAGPVILAVTYTLLKAWVEEDLPSADPPAVAGSGTAGAASSAP